MRHRHFVGVAVLLLANGACAPAPDALTDADVAAIRATGQEFMQAVLAADYERVVALHTNDAVWMNPDAPAAVGPDALRRALETGPRALSFVITSAHTEGVASLAYDRGSYTYRALLGADTIMSRGKYVQVLRRQAGGSWRIAVDIWNSDEPPVPPPGTSGS